MPGGLRSGSPHSLTKQAGLRDLCWIKGKNLAFEFRWADNVDQLAGLAADLLPLKATLADSISTGHVASLPRPGGNITGPNQPTCPSSSLLNSSSLATARPPARSKSNFLRRSWHAPLQCSNRSTDPAQNFMTQ
jgi:hypothetical protein